MVQPEDKSAFSACDALTACQSMRKKRQQGRGRVSPFYRVGKRTKRNRINAPKSSALGIAVRQSAWYRGNFGNPTAVFLTIKLHRKRIRILLSFFVLFCKNLRHTLLQYTANEYLVKIKRRLVHRCLK